MYTVVSNSIIKYVTMDSYFQFRSILDDHKRFANTHRRSSDDVSPKQWGAAGWTFIDSIVDSYPVQPLEGDKMHMLDFISSLAFVLPCKKCRANYYAFTQKNDPSQYVHSRSKLKFWIARLKESK